MYKININDRNYTSWEIFNNDTLSKLNIDINPIKEKLLSNDVFKFDNNKVTIIHSSIRSGTCIPGVLILENNKTYGREKKTDNGGTYTPAKLRYACGRLLYKCIPDDTRLPSFVVPYEIKHMGFSKAFKNLYVTFKFENWDDKHPRGKLDCVIGPIDILDNFYEYQLYCKSLNTSIQKFQKDTSKSIENNNHDSIIEIIMNKYKNIEDRTNQNKWYIITIDPLNSLDYDDGFSYNLLDNNIQQLSIYISNVTLWMDVLNLWNSFSRRISTIYLPDKKRPMLPSILSESLCSLQENVKRIAFVMDIFIKDNEIIQINFNNALIKVVKNYVYEEPKLLGDLKYHEILNKVQNISKKYKYINNVRNSHDVVCYLMILMNYHSATELIKYKTGIFRSTIVYRKIYIPETLPEDVSKFITIWNSSSGQYINGTEIIDSRHELLDVDAYIHITSPIRRLVDLLNMIKLQQEIKLINLSDSANIFYNNWLNELDYINVTMRSIRKFQCDCSLLDICNNNPKTLEKIYEGYVFDKINRNDGLYQYIIYLPELKLSSKITLRDSYNNFEVKEIKLYLFNDEENFKRKIRLQIL